MQRHQFEADLDKVFDWRRADTRLAIAGKRRETLHWFHKSIPRSSNGRTAAFGAVNRGSNPCRGAKSLIINHLEADQNQLYGNWYKFLWKTPGLERPNRPISQATPGVEGVYNTAHNDCRFDGKRLPPAAAVQQLVAAWKVMRRMHRAK